MGKSDSANKQLLSCLFCKKLCKTQVYLEQHISLHTGERHYQCSVCDADFNFCSNYWVHCHKNHEGNGYEATKIRPSDNRFGCGKCTAKYCSRSSLRRHYEKMHSASNKTLRSYKQQPCIKLESRVKKRRKIQKIGKSARLKDNGKILHWNQINSCLFCDKVFQYQATFQAHMNTHTGERPYGCIYCDNNFANQPGCIIHMKKCRKLVAVKKNKHSSEEKVLTQINTEKVTLQKCTVKLEQLPTHPQIVVDLTTTKAQEELVQDKTLSVVPEENVFTANKINDNLMQPAENSKPLNSQDPQNLDELIPPKAAALNVDDIEVLHQKLPQKKSLIFQPSHQTAIIKRSKVCQMPHTKMKHSCLFCYSEFSEVNELWWHVKDNHKIRFHIFRATFQPALPVI